MDNKALYEIKKTQEEIRRLAETPKSRGRWAYWKDPMVDFDYWRAIPRSKDTKPFVVDFERQGHAEVLGFSLKEFYTDPYAYVLHSLRILLHKFHTFEDCTPLRKVIVFIPGAGFEKAIFGSAQVITEQDAWVGRDIVIHERADIAALTMPDFHTSGNMPEIINFYEKMREITDDDFTVTFPQWSRSPWGVAWHLRGIDNLLLDYADDPQWVRDFVGFITDVRIHWAEQRAEYLGCGLKVCNIYNDEVLSPVVSPELYRAIILPSEIKLSERFGGVHYWHSCGNVTPFLHDINQIPNLYMSHVSPWTDIRESARVYDPEKTAIEVDLHGHDDVLNASGENQIRHKLESFKRDTKDFHSLIRAAGLEIVHDVKTDLENIQRWIKCAHSVFR